MIKLCSELTLKFKSKLTKKTTKKGSKKQNGGDGENNLFAYVQKLI